MEYNELLSKHSIIEEAYVVVSLFEVYIGTQKIKIKIKKDLNNGKFSYSNSHHYHGSEQASPYASSMCVMIDTELEALNSALRELISFYNPSDVNATWVESENF